MVLNRKAPKCSECGEKIKAVYRQQEPHKKPLYGDLFSHWDWDGHVCRGKQMTNITRKEAFKRFKEYCQDISNHMMIPSFVSFCESRGYNIINGVSFPESISIEQSMINNAKANEQNWEDRFNEKYGLFDMQYKSEYEKTINFIKDLLETER